MAFKTQKAADRLSQIVLDAGEQGILRSEAYRILNEEGLLPESSQLKGQMAFMAKVKRFGSGEKIVYVHRTFTDKKKKERGGCETQTFTLGGKGTVTIKGPGVQGTFDGVKTVTLVRIT